MGQAAGSINDVTAIKALPEPVKGWVLEAFTRSMDDVFLIAVPFMAVAFIVAITMKEKELKGRHTEPVRADAASPDEAALVSVGH